MLFRSARYGFGPEHIIDYKGLAGDTSDNIIGIPGIGEKTATELIKSFGSIESMYAALEKNENALVEKGFKARVQSLVADHRDEAEFSKVLATIRLDAPIEFVEPEKTFIESIDAEAAIGFAEEMGFRSLVPRIRVLATSEEQKPDTKKTAAKTELVPTALTSDEQKLLKECAVMVFILNSDIANPTIDDVFSMSKTKNLVDAHSRLTSMLAKESLDTVYTKIEKP